MAYVYSPLGRANRLGGLKIRILFYCDNGASDYSRAADSSCYPEHDYYLNQPLPQYGHYGQQQEQTRERHPGIDKPLHNEVYFTAKESRNAAYQYSNYHIESGRGQTDSQRNTSPIDDSAQEVSPQVVGTKQIPG